VGHNKQISGDLPISVRKMF